MSVSLNQPVTIRHGLGRQVEGWNVIWMDAAVQFYVNDPKADTAQDLVLVPNATANVRLVLF